jgi:hypothetical protein
MGKNKMNMRKTMLSICCLIGINAVAQTPSMQVKEFFERAWINQSFRVENSDFIFYNDQINEEELRKIFEINKEYFKIDKRFSRDIFSFMGSLYSASTNKNLRHDVVLFAEQSLNDSLVDGTSRRYVSDILIKGVDLQLFDKKMKDEVFENLNTSYKSSKNNILDKNMILLAGALNMNELTDRLHIIADSSNITDHKNAARIALCRMGDKETLKEYFSNLHSMSLQDILDRHAEIEYIKQNECIVLLLQILYSEETYSAIKETWPAEKFAYYAMEVIERISTNCPIKVQRIYSDERDNALKQVRKWTKEHEIIINREVW